MTDAPAPAAVLAAYDALAARVFATLCRATDGDTDAASSLLVETFVRSPQLADELWAPDGGCTAAVVAAHRAALGLGSSFDRAVADLCVVERLATGDVADALGADAEAVGAVLDRVRAEHGGSDDEVRHALTRAETWFDDARRADCRRSLAAALDAAEDELAETAGRDRGSSTPPERRRRRRTVAAAGIAAGLLIGLLAIRSWSDDAPADHVAAPATTIERRSRKDPMELPEDGIVVQHAKGALTPEAVATTTVQSAPDAQPYPNTDGSNFVLDPVPAGFVGTEVRHRPTDALPGQYVEVWASEGATRTSGMWFAIAHNPDDRSAPVFDHPQELRRDGYGTRIDWRAPDGVLYTAQRRPGGEVVYSVSFGMGDQALVALSATPLAADGSFVHDDGFAAEVDRLAPLFAGWVDGRGFPTSIAASTRSAVYRGTSTGAGMIEVITGEQQPNDIAVTRLLTPPPTFDVDVGAERMMAVNDRGALIGAVWAPTPVVDSIDLAAAGTARTYAMWHAGGRTVRVVGSMPIDDLMSVARAVRSGTAEEWQALRNAPALDAASSARWFWTFTSIGSNTTDDGSMWNIGWTDVGGGSVSVQQVRDARPAEDDPDGAAAASAMLPLQVDPSNPVHTLVTFDATILVVLFGADPGAPFVRATIDDTGGLLATLVPVQDRWLAAIAVDHEHLARLSLVAADGTVVRDL